jgi:hypothetical protein
VLPSPYGQPSGYPGVARYPGAPPDGSAPGGKRKRGWLPWAIGGAAVVVIGGIVAGLLLSGGSKKAAASGSTGGKGGSAGASAGGSAIPAPLVFAGTPTAVTGRLSDPTSGLSWAKLGSPWTPLPSAVLSVGDWKAGQQLVTDTFKITGGRTSNWTASIDAGVPGSDVQVPYKGPSTLKQYAVGVVNNVILTKEYPPGTAAAGNVSQPLTVSGHPGWIVNFNAHFKQAGVKATQDTDVVVVVDTGKAPRPSVFFISVPNDANQLLPDITAELRSLRVGP